MHGRKLLIHSVQLLKFGNGYVISSHMLLGMWLLIHTVMYFQLSRIHGTWDLPNLYSDQSMTNGWCQSTTISQLWQELMSFKPLAWYDQKTRCDQSQNFYGISQEICTRFCCVLLCCGYAIVHNEFTWSIYSYSSGLLCWHWGNR